MLVLKRKLKETVTLTLPTGETVIVSFQEFDRGCVRLGFEAPASIKIFRTELLKEGIRHDP